MKNLNDPFEQLARYERKKKKSNKNKLKEKKLHTGKGKMRPIYCGREKIKFTKILNIN